MLDIVIEGEEGVPRSLGVVAEGMADFAVPTQAALELVADSILTNIVTGGRPPYPDIQERSRSRRRADQGAPPLWDTGAMADAATATRAGVEGSLYALDGMSGQIGVVDGFHGARRHQMGFVGTDALGRHVVEPARAFFHMQDEDEAAVIEVFARYLAALCHAEAK